MKVTDLFENEEQAIATHLDTQMRSLCHQLHDRMKLRFGGMAGECVTELSHSHDEVSGDPVIVGVMIFKKMTLEMARQVRDTFSTILGKPKQRGIFIEWRVRVPVTNLQREKRTVIVRMPYWPTMNKVDELHKSELYIPLIGVIKKRVRKQNETE